MKAKTMFGMMMMAVAVGALCQCGTTKAQRQAIAVNVGEDVLADVAAGAPVLLTTGSGTAAALAAGTQEVENLKQLQANVGKILQAKPATAEVAASVVNTPVVPAAPVVTKASP